MTITRLDSGNLAITSEPEEREEIRSMMNQKGITPLGAEVRFINQVLRFRFVFPEQVGALTDAPLMTDGQNVYGYMNYQIRSFMEELANGQEVIFQKG